MLPNLPTTTVRLVQYGPQVIDADGIPTWPIVADVTVSDVIQEPWRNTVSQPRPEGIRAHRARLFHVPGQTVQPGTRDGTERADEIVWDGRVWRASEVLHGVAMPGIPARSSVYALEVGPDDQPPAGVTP